VLNKTVYNLSSNGYYVIILTLIYHSNNDSICVNMEKSIPLAVSYTGIILKHSTWQIMSGYLDTFHYINILLHNSENDHMHVDPTYTKPHAVTLQ
jgi:hypothetical protein